MKLRIGMAVFFAACGLCAVEPAPAEEEIQRIPYKELKTLQWENMTISAMEEVILALPPEKWEQLKTLRKTDPGAAQKFLQAEQEARTTRKQELTRKINETARQVRRTKDPAEKERLTRELESLLKQDYERVSTEITVRIRLQEARLEAVRKGLRSRLNHQEQAISKQLKRMTQPRPPKSDRKQKINAEKKNTAPANTTKKEMETK